MRRPWSVSVEQEPEVGRPNLVIGIEPEGSKQVEGALPRLVDSVLVLWRLLFDLDVLAEARDGVQDDAVAVEFVAVTCLFDRRDGLEAEGLEDLGRVGPALDAGLDLRTGLGRCLDQRTLVGESCLHRTVLRDPSHAECFVGLGEVAVRRVEVGVRLLDPTEERRTLLLEAFANRVVHGGHLHLHLVHGRGNDGTDGKVVRSPLAVQMGCQNVVTARGESTTPPISPRDARFAGRRRNVVLKGGTGVRCGMSEEEAAETVDEPEAADEPEAEDEDQDGLQAGDFIQLAYTARTVEDDELVDTTDKEVAEDEGVDTEERDFSPRTIVLGEGHLFETVEEDIYGKEVGDTGSVVVESAFGEYDEEEVRTVASDKIPEDNRYPGAHVDIDGQHGHVEAIIGGRARVDFNHPLAGEDIEYEYEVTGEVTDRLERAQGLLQMYFDVELDMHIETDEVEEEVENDDGETETETVEKETLYIEQSPQLQFNQQWMMGKSQILTQVMDMCDLDRVIVQEIIDGSGMGGMGGMMGGMGGMGGGDVDLEEALEDVDVDADEIAEELEAEDLDVDEE